MTAETHPPGSDRSTDLHWSARALELAAQADFRTSPNPMVGAVVLDREGHLAGEGFHKGPGQPHAEQEALAEAGERANGGTLYVNLEPCTHAHRTPSCADAVIESGIYRTVISMSDPDERVRGAGIKALDSARIRTTVGLHADRAQRLNEFYVKHRLTGRPFVSAKFAMSLDGKIATRAGESRWITGDESRRHGHRLRSQHDAILVDKIYAYIAPRLIGGKDAPGPLGGDGIEHLRDAAGLTDLDFTRLGDDILISAYTSVHGDR